MQSPLDSISLFSFFSFESALAFMYSFAMLIYWTGAFFILYHLIRFGISGQPKKIAVVFMVGSLVLSIITTLFFAQILI